MNVDRKTAIIVGVVVVSAVAVGTYIYLTKYRDHPKGIGSLSDHFAVVDTGKNMLVKPVNAPQPTLVLLYADWCPHCEHMMGDWKQTQQTLQGNVNVIAIESKDPRMSKFQCSGFPTIRMYPNGLDSDDFVEYTGPRQAREMIAFATGRQ